MAIVSTLVEQERAADPNLLLLDNGDTIQGTPLIYYYNTKKTDETNPMAAVMNAMGYDAMTIGNTEAISVSVIGDCFAALAMTTP